MSFDNFKKNIKLNNISAYSGVNSSASSAFKIPFYSDIEEIDYGSYEEVDYTAIDLQKGIEAAIESANDQPWWKDAYDYTMTITASLSWGSFRSSRKHWRWITNVR